MRRAGGKKNAFELDVNIVNFAWGTKPGFYHRSLFERNILVSLDFPRSLDQGVYIYIIYSIPFKAAMQSPLDFIFLFFWWKFPMQHHDLPTIRASRSSASRTCLELLGWISRLPRDPSGPGILDFSPLTIGLWSNKHGDFTMKNRDLTS